MKMQIPLLLRSKFASTMGILNLFFLFGNPVVHGQSINVEGKLQIADDASADMPGQLRFRNGAFEGYYGNTWNRIRDRPDTVVISINPFAFRPETNPNNWDITVEKLTKSSGNDSAIAMLQLPSNAKIIGMGGTYLDNSPDDLQLFLYSTMDLTKPIVWYDTNTNSTFLFYEEVPVDHEVPAFPGSYFLRIKPEFGHEWDGDLTCLRHVTIRYVIY